MADVPLSAPVELGISVFACLVARLQLLTNFAGQVARRRQAVAANSQLAVAQ